jgi:MFS family permease
MAVEPESSVLDALKTSRFWLLFIAYSFSGLVINGLLAHMVVWVTDFGTTAALAGLFVTMYNAPSVISRVGGGWLGDRLGKSRVLISGASLAAFIMLLTWLWAHGVNQLFILVPLMGLGINLATGLYAPHLGDLFGRKNVGALFALVTGGWGLIGGLGPILWGYIYDHDHSYSLALFISIICYAVAAVSLLLARKSPQRPAAAAPIHNN